MLTSAVSHSYSSVLCTRMLDRLCCTSGMQKHTFLCIQDDINIITSIFSDHNAVRLDLNYRRRQKKHALPSHRLQKENKNHRKLTKMIIWITALWSYKSCCAGPHKADRSQWRVLTKHGPLEKWMANHSSGYSCFENPMNSMKRQKNMTRKMSPPGQ